MAATLSTQWRGDRHGGGEIDAVEGRLTQWRGDRRSGRDSDQKSRSKGRQLATSVLGNVRIPIGISV